MDKIDPEKVTDISRAIAELRTALDQISSPPWNTVHFDDDKFMSATAIVGSGQHVIGRPPSDQVIAVTLLQTPPIANSSDNRFDENAEFICIVRNKLPNLLELLEKLGF